MEFSHTDSSDSGLGKGQSAIEYLMTYGWMLLVVAVVGGAVFAVVGDQSVDSVTGFSGGDVLVDDFGVTSDGNLSLALRSGDSGGVVVSRVNVSDPDTGQWVYKEFTGDNRIGVGSSKVFELPNVSRSGSGNVLDVEIVYDSGGLSNLSVSGTVSGSLELTDSGSYSGDPEGSNEAIDGGGGSPEDFQLSGVSDDGPVTEGDTVSVDYTVSNNGGVSGSQDVVLDVSGTQEDVNSSVSLNSGGSSSGVLEWVTESGDAGSGIGYTVSTSNDSVSGTVDVNSLTGPTASASDNVTQPEVDDVVEFDGSGSTQGDGSITSYDWDVNGDGSYEKSGEFVTHSYSSSGVKNVELNVTDDNGLSSTDSLSVDVQPGTVSASGAPSFSTAPNGAEYESSWVPVTSSSSVSNGFSYFFDETSDEEYYNVSEGFYVMKYEAKAYNTSSSSFVSDGGSSDHWADSSIVPRSVAANKPWRQISFNEGSPDTGYGAVQACEALDSQTDEFDVHLLTNREWMTVARQVEQTDSNWVGGTVDSSGQLVRGWSDGDFFEDAPLSASTSDSDGKAGILEEDSTNGWSSDSDIPDHQNRTFDLANGEVVWDWAGNVRQWVYSEDSGGSTTNGVFDSDNPGGLKYEKDPAVVDRSTNGVGTDYGFNSGQAALRGGYWGNGGDAGLFYARSYNPDYAYSNFGFRCSAVPVS